MPNKSMCPSGSALHTSPGIVSTARRRSFCKAGLSRASPRASRMRHSTWERRSYLGVGPRGMAWATTWGRCSALISVRQGRKGSSLPTIALPGRFWCSVLGPLFVSSYRPAIKREKHVTTDRPERRQLRDRRHNVFPDLHERLEIKRLAIESERRHLIRRDADRSACGPDAPTGHDGDHRTGA